ILFEFDIRGYGSSMGWGLGYAVFWWFLGPLTLLPLAAGDSLDWSADQSPQAFGSLVGHILYGLILGVVYATIDRIRVRLFIESDPLNRVREGAGVHVLRSLEWGAAAGLAGGLIASPILIASGLTWPQLTASVLIGMTYGVLFRDESS